MSQFIVVDLEMCRVPSYSAHYPLKHETIQIGAVRLNEQYEIVDEFNTFVKPEFGRLDRFISNLTAIKGKDLKDAPTMDTALSMFIDWIPADAVVVSWSNSDLKQIKGEAKAKHLSNDRLPLILKNWIE